MREFVARASIEANANYVWVRTHSESGLSRIDYAAGISRFDRGVPADILGQAVLDALGKSRRVGIDELRLLTEGLGIVERSRLWDQDEMAVLGYKTLRTMYKDMISVMIRRPPDAIVFTPLRHSKLQAWEGFAEGDKDHEEVVIDAGAMAGSVGEAALVALSRCA
jgi:hypothetical protein